MQSKLETRTTKYPKYFPLAISEARGSTIKDFDGNIFIDWFAGICVLNLGYAHPDVMKAMQHQLRTLVHINEMPTQIRIEFLKTLVSILPGGLKDKARIMPTVTGGHACEVAMSLARLVSKKRTIVAFSGAYHGTHGSAAGATANWEYREYAGVPAYATYHLPYPYSYRFPFKVPEGDQSNVVISMLESIIVDHYSGPGPIGGVICEPIQGEGGYIVPPKEFLPMLREVTEKYSIPLILDEEQTGLGRTGSMWACENSSVTPDIICISKSIGGGIPTSVVAYRDEYDSIIPEGFNHGTYRANPVAMAAGTAVMRVLTNTDLIQMVRSEGSEILARFKELGERSERIGDVRGKGFMIGVEMVKNKRTKQPGDVASKLRSRLVKKGLIMHTCGHFGNVMRFMAPLTIEDDLIDAGLDVFADGVNSL
jgi:diaminobutyrate-2-oxoglutarate transaminase